MLISYLFAILFQRLIHISLFHVFNLMPSVSWILWKPGLLNRSGLTADLSTSLDFSTYLDFRTGVLQSKYGNKIAIIDLL